jgi:dihydrofolate synthase/folylpolyglutamate synthase
MSSDPLIIYDGGHNEQAIKNLKESINMYYKNYKKIYIVSILNRKDYEKILKMLLEDDEDSTFIFTTGNSEERYTAKEVLFNIAKKYKKKSQKIFAKDLEEAIKDIMKIKNKDIVTFVIGSFYIYGDVDSYIKSGK